MSVYLDGEKEGSRVKKKSFKQKALFCYYYTI